MKKRYIIYLSLIGLIVLQFVSPPVLPVIQLPGEIIAKWPGGKEFLGGWFGGGLTNTFISSVLAVLIILIIAFVLRAPSRTAEEVPTGFYNFFEMLIEMAYGYVENAAGKWAKAFFPFFMTFILWIVIANWMELVPGVDAIGKWEDLRVFKAEQAVEEAEAEAEANGETLTEDQIHDIEVQVEEEIDVANIGGVRQGVFLASATDANKEDADYTIVPYVRAAATDLNFTIALAIISVVMTQYYGMKAQGAKYWRKFFPFYKGKGDEIAKNPLAVMDIGVGLLEFISEIFKIVSFAFRLLGNIFAGQVLLFVIASLLPIANLLFWHLEFGVGLLQGVVFALLTLTFMVGATQSHGEEH
jgi:F-type H+-transporting ATPase subunit a